jgi:hypothetical protein
MLMSMGTNAESCNRLVSIAWLVGEPLKKHNPPGVNLLTMAARLSLYIESFHEYALMMNNWAIRCSMVSEL